MEEQELSKSTAVLTCTFMAAFYVAILYFPTLILRLPPPSSFKHFLVRRFICAAISSVVSVCVSSLILPIKSWELFEFFGVYGIRIDHFWQAVAFPLSLTSLMYLGSLFLKFLLLVEGWTTCESGKLDYIKHVVGESAGSMMSSISNVKAWRNYVVAPLTEELVFRACMVPLLLCGGFGTYATLFLGPIFFSLDSQTGLEGSPILRLANRVFQSCTHLNHLREYYTQENFSILKAFMVVGLQLGYTVVFGSYASFLFIQTGNLVAPLVAHVFCNFMGLPVLFSRRSGLVSVAFVAGMVSFLWLLVRLTRPNLYNDRTDNCSCWHGYCT